MVFRSKLLSHTKVIVAGFFALLGNHLAYRKFLDRGIVVSNKSLHFSLLYFYLLKPCLVNVLTVSETVHVFSRIVTQLLREFNHSPIYAFYLTIPLCHCPVNPQPLWNIAAYCLDPTYKNIVFYALGLVCKNIDVSASAGHVHVY